MKKAARFGDSNELEAGLRKWKYVCTFFGVLSIDTFYSANLAAKMKKFADERELVLRYELLKAHIREAQENAKEKIHFFVPFGPRDPLRGRIEEYLDRMEKEREQAR